MAKYNLLDNKKPDNLDRIFDQREPESAKPSSSDDKSEIQPATNFYDQREEMLDESLFEGGKPDAEAPAIDKEKEDKPFADTVTEKPVSDMPESLKTPSKSTKTPSTDFKDEKQTGMNYKPILIGLGIVLIVVVLVLLGYNYFFSGAGNEPLPVREKKVDQAAPTKMTNEKDARKKAFLTQIQSEKRHRLSYFAVLSNIKAPDVYYSSILLYGTNLNFEIFSPDRGNIARFNMQIKNNQYISNSEIVSVDQRPGDNGGVFALYNVVLNPADPSAPGGGAAISSGNKWLQTQATQSGLNRTAARQINTHKENLFLITRMEYTFNGSQKNCLKFLNAIANSNLNASVHKLSMIPVNQQNFKNARFKMQLIVDLYN